jgi:hypothetical protein
MKAATLSQSTSRIPQPAVYPLEGLTKTSNRKTAVLVGLCFLMATFTFAIGSALIHSHFSGGTSRDGTLVAGVFLLAGTGLAVVTNGLAMRSALTPHIRLRSQAYLILRAVECLTIVAIGGYFLTSRTQWNASVLPVYAVSGAAGLILSSALWTSRLVPRNVSMLGLIGYPVFLLAFGLPLVVHGGARVEDLVDRFVAGDSVADIAYDFDVPSEEVETSSVSPREQPPEFFIDRSLGAGTSPRRCASAGSSSTPWHPSTVRRRASGSPTNDGSETSARGDGSSS